MNFSEGSTRGRFVLFAAIIVVTFLLFALIFGKEANVPASDRKADAMVTAGITAKMSDYQNQPVSYDASQVIMTAASEPTQDEAALVEEETSEDETEISIYDEIDQAEQLIGDFAEVKGFDIITTSDLVPDEVKSSLMEMSGVIEAEAAGDLPLMECVAVGASILYRIDDSYYPDSIEGNIYKANQYAKPKKPSVRAQMAALLSYKFWAEGRLEELLPHNYHSFFGWGRHNYFYDSSNYHIYEGLISLPEGIYDAQREIIPELH